MSTRVRIPDALRRATELYPTKAAIVFGDRTLSYAELQERAGRVANLLRHGLGLGHGARFGLIAQNTIEFAELYLGAAMAGCVCVPVNYRLVAPEAARILADAGARVLIADARLSELVAGMADREGFDGECLWIGDGPAGGRRYEAELARSSARFSAPEEHHDSDVVLQMYTSGTTGFPKGAMLSHRSLLANSWSSMAEGNVVTRDVYLLTSPLCHLAAGARIISVAHAGGTLRVEPGFDADRVLELIQSGAVTTGVFVPTMVQSLLDAAGERPRRQGRFRRLTYGSAPMPRPVVAHAMELFGCDFQQGYGLTEASPNVAVLQPEDHVLEGPPELLRRLESVGRPTVGVLVRIVDEDDHDVAPGEKGEVIVRGANVMEGYWQRPEETAAALRGGWLHTGDVGVMDEERYIYIVDRKLDMLISGGLNVYPREVEVQLETHPAILEVAVVGVPDERWGEVPVAFIVPRRGADPAAMSPDRLEAWCRERLAAYKVPRRYRYLEVLPRTMSGKVLKRNLRERLEAERR